MNRFVLRQIFCCPGLPRWPGKRDYMENFQPGFQDPGNRDTGILANRAHVIAKLIFVVFKRRAKITANRASPAHEIGPLVLCCLTARKLREKKCAQSIIIIITIIINNRRL